MLVMLLSLDIMGHIAKVMLHMPSFHCYFNYLWSGYFLPDFRVKMKPCGELWNCLCRTRRRSRQQRCKQKMNILSL